MSRSLGLGTPALLTEMCCAAAVSAVELQMGLIVEPDDSGSVVGYAAPDLEPGGCRGAESRPR